MIVIIAGIHGSGTRYLAQCFNEVIPMWITEAGGGHFEDKDILAINERELKRHGTKWYGKENCGDGMLAAKVIEKKPRYHVFGHIHEGYGQFISDYGTTFVNCSVINEAYNLVNEPIVIDI